jgi:transposase
MDTNLSVAVQGRRRGKYRQYSVQLKRAVVEQSLMAGASVSRIAQEHAINANQVFAWRKAYKEGRLGESASSEMAFLPVAVKSAEKLPALIQTKTALPTQGRILIERQDVRLSIEGRPDAHALQQVLAVLLQ